MSDLFYERVAPLDELKEVGEPSVEQAEEVKRLIDSDVLERYFFDDLENPGWIPPFHQLGLFLEAPQRREVSPGQFQLPVWPAGRYLSRHGQHYPDIVLTVAGSLETDNPQAYAELLKALVKLDPAVSRAATPAILRWLAVPFSDQVLYELKDYVGSLIVGDHLQDAGRIVAALLEPSQPHRTADPEVGFAFVEAKPRFGEFWLRELVREFLPKLSEGVPLDLIYALDSNLDKAQQFEREARNAPADARISSYWRSAIEAHPQNVSIHALKDLLVDGIRDALIALCSTDPDEGSRRIETYIGSNDPIRQRIALYALTKFGDRYPDLLASVVSDRSMLEDPEIHHEMYQLLAAQFESSGSEVQNLVVGWLLEGPSDVELVADRLAKQVPEEEIESELARYRDHWTLRRLWSIREFLDATAKARLDELTKSMGEPDHPDFLMWSTGVRAVTHVSPLSVDEIASLPFDEIARVLIEYSPPSPSMEDSREGLAEALAGAAKANPSRFVDFAAVLIDMQIRYIYIYHYLTAMREVISAGEQIDLDGILRLCSVTAATTHDPHQQDGDRHEPGLRAAHFEIGNLIEEILKQENSTITDENLAQITELIAVLLENPDPEVDSELQSGWDAASRSLNNVRGKAMHNVIQYARYRESKARELPGDETYRPALDPFVKETLEAKLDKSVDPSLSVHSVYGWYLPFIEYLDRDWLRAHLHQILPVQRHFEQYWRAAWDAYVSFNNVYRRPFLLLVPHYSRAVSHLSSSDDPGRLGTSSRQRLGEHIAYAYIHGVIDIESEDGLLRAFYGAADDDLRGHVAFWLSRVPGEIELTTEDAVWQRMWRLLNWRIEEAATLGARSKFEEEISSYMRWLKAAPVDFGELEPVVRLSVPYVRQGFHGKLIAEYLAIHAKEYPRQAIEILHQLILQSDSPWTSIYEAELDMILRAAITSNDKIANSEAVGLINLLGERGDFRWKHYLQSI